MFSTSTPFALGRYKGSDFDVIKEKSRERFNTFCSGISRASRVTINTQSSRGSQASRTDELSEDVVSFKSAVIFNYFLRLSSAEKINFMTRLILKMRSSRGAASVLNMFFPLGTKLTSYSLITDESNFTFDTILEDHNRSLEGKALAACLTDDVAWFERLSEDKQVALIINLMRISGGRIQKRIYVELIRQFNRQISNSFPVKFSSYKADPYWDFLDSNINRERYIEEFPPYVEHPPHEDSLSDPKDPLDIEVAEGRKAWRLSMDTLRQNINAKIKIENEKYRLENVVPVKKPETKTSSITPKGGASKKPSPSKPASPKSPKKPQFKEPSELDWLQLLPIWIIKSIFGYLDDKSMQNARLVNAFWFDVVEDVIQEQKMRKVLNDYIAKCRANFNNLFTNIPSTQTKNVAPSKFIMQNRNKMNKQLKALYKRGAALKKITTTKDKTIDIALITDAFQSINDAVSYPLQKLRIFPRNIVNTSYFPLFPANEYDDTCEKINPTVVKSFDTEEDSKSMATTSSIPSIILSTMDLLETW